MSLRTEYTSVAFFSPMKSDESSRNLAASCENVSVVMAMSY
jgi:hypothetical protein